MLQRHAPKGSILRVLEIEEDGPQCELALDLQWQGERRVGECDGTPNRWTRGSAALERGKHLVSSRAWFM